MMKFSKTQVWSGAFACMVAGSAAASVPGGLFEAESANVITSASVKSLATASGGWYVDGNDGFKLTWLVDLEGGDKKLTFRIKVPSGARSMGVYVNNTKIGTVASGSTAWGEATVEAVVPAGVNTIELRDSEGTAEPDVDYLLIEKVTQYTFQVEDMLLDSGYVVQSNTVAANGAYVHTGSTGTATRVFGKPVGQYSIDTYYFDETDGIGTYQLRIDGVLVDTWLANGTFGTSGVSVESRTFHRTSGVSMQTNSVIQLLSTRNNGEYGRADEMIFTVEETTLFEAEDMVLKGYVVETNSSASGGLLVRLAAGYGYASHTVDGISSGYYDLTIAYFDETDGAAAFKVYVDDVLVDAWLADRQLGSSDAIGLNRMERTIKNVYLKFGDALEICGFNDGGEDCRIDGFSIQTAAPSPACFMDWNADGSIATLVLNSSEHLDAAEASGVEFRIFDGYSIDTIVQDAAAQSGALVELHDDEFDYVRVYFRAESYDHHLLLRLVGYDGIPPNDPSLNIRLEIPFLSTLGYQLLDNHASVRTVGGDLLEIDWPQLSTRGLLAGGRIALYATADAAAALAEIEQVHTDNGNLDDYYAWIGGYPLAGTDADLFADPDGDGLNNLTEYALGGAPNLGGDGANPEILHSETALDVLYNRRRDFAERGLAYTLWMADDLLDPVWSTNGPAETGARVLDADFESVTNAVETAGTTNGFIRLDIELRK